MQIAYWITWMALRTRVWTPFCNTLKLWKLIYNMFYMFGIKLPCLTGRLFITFFFCFTLLFLPVRWSCSSKWTTEQKMLYAGSSKQKASQSLLLDYKPWCCSFSCHLYERSKLPFLSNQFLKCKRLESSEGCNLVRCLGQEMRAYMEDIVSKYSTFTQEGSILKRMFPINMTKNSRDYHT